MGFGKYLKKDVHRRVICGLTCSIILFSHYKVNGVKNYCNVNMITPIQWRKCSWKIRQNNFQWLRILKGLENTKCIDTTDKHYYTRITTKFIVLHHFLYHFCPPEIRGFNRISCHRRHKKLLKGIDNFSLTLFCSHWVVKLSDQFSPKRSFGLFAL